jgi:hypothetical protein
VDDFLGVPIEGQDQCVAADLIGPASQIRQQFLVPQVKAVKEPWSDDRLAPAP